MRHAPAAGRRVPGLMIAKIECMIQFQNDLSYFKWQLNLKFHGTVATWYEYSILCTLNWSFSGGMQMMPAVFIWKNYCVCVCVCVHVHVCVCVDASAHIYA